MYYILSWFLHSIYPGMYLQSSWLGLYQFPGVFSQCRCALNFGTQSYRVLYLDSSGMVSWDTPFASNYSSLLD